MSKAYLISCEKTDGKTHFIGSKGNEYTWAACSIGCWDDALYLYKFTDDPDKTTCGACKRTRIYKQAKAQRAKP